MSHSVLFQPDNEPVKRHIPPHLPPTSPSPQEDPRVLEALLRQNQILLELLASFNGLTAALLARERAHSRE